jgi:hypothetical protein
LELSFHLFTQHTTTTTTTTITEKPHNLNLFNTHISIPFQKAPASLGTCTGVRERSSSHKRGKKEKERKKKMRSFFVLAVVFAVLCRAEVASEVGSWELVRPTDGPTIDPPQQLGITIDELITIGKTIWQVVKDGKPVVNYAVDWAVRTHPPASLPHLREKSFFRFLTKFLARNP